MKQHRDAARLRLSTVHPSIGDLERERIARLIAKDCSREEIIELMTEAIEQQARAKNELAHADLRVLILNRARARK